MFEYQELILFPPLLFDIMKNLIPSFSVVWLERELIPDDEVIVRVLLLGKVGYARHRHVPTSAKNRGRKKLFKEKQTFFPEKVVKFRLF